MKGGGVMETKEITDKLRSFYLDFVIRRVINADFDFEVFEFAASRLEQQEVKIEELHDFSEMQKEEISILKKQLSEKQPEWISVEDERKPKHLQNYFVAYVFGNGKEHFFREAIYIADKGNGIVDGPHFNDEGVDGMRVTHWMEIPKVSDPPKPKEPSFKDVFLKAFPKAQLYSDGIPIACRANIFGEKCLMKSKCSECWNQPYFEEEGGEDV